MVPEITEILRRSKQGITRPFICKASDNHTYFVKGKSATREGLIREKIAGELAKRIGLPIAPFCVLNCAHELISPNTHAEINDLGAGPVFGSRSISGSELAYSVIGAIPIEIRLKLLYFDFWIKNADRTLTKYGGNPNLLWRSEVGELVVIDHNLAFDADFDAVTFSKTHAFSESCRRTPADHVFINSFSETLEQCLADWDDIISDIPHEWLYIDSALTQKTSIDFKMIRQTLKSFKEPDFWRLK